MECNGVFVINLRVVYFGTRNCHVILVVQLAGNCKRLMYLYFMGFFRFISIVKNELVVKAESFFTFMHSMNEG